MKKKYFGDTAWVKVMSSPMMTSHNGKSFFIFKALKVIPQFRVFTWLRQNILKIEH